MLRHTWKLIHLSSEVQCKTAVVTFVYKCDWISFALLKTLY